MSFEKFLVDGGGCFKDYCVKAKGRHQKKKKNCRFGENFVIYLTPSPPNERVKNKRMKYW